MNRNQNRQDGEGIRRRLAELNDVYSGKSKKSGFRLNFSIVLPIAVVIVIALLLRQG